VKTYCQNQIEKPLRICAVCKKPWYMLRYVCADCEDRYLVMRTPDVRDVSGNVMTEP